MPDDKYLRNACKPEGDFGAEVLHTMNEHHKELADWAFSHVQIAPTAHAIDIGCGGGANVERLLALCPDGHVDGVDYSPTSVEETIRRNQAAIDAGRCAVQEGDVAALPYEGATFDFASACETIYFWPDLDAALADVKRVLVPGGTFLVICEMGDPNDPRFTNADYITVRTGQELAQIIKNAGFSDVSLDETGEWFCIVARV